MSEPTKGYPAQRRWWVTAQRISLDHRSNSPEKPFNRRSIGGAMLAQINPPPQIKAPGLWLGCPFLVGIGAHGAPYVGYKGIKLRRKPDQSWRFTGFCS